MTYFPRAQLSLNPDGAETDPFGRLRVSNNHLLLSSQLTYDLLPLVWETSTVGGLSSVVHLPNESSALLTAGVTAGDKAVRQTKRYWLYRAGQGHSIAMTFAGLGQTTDYRKRVGYFDANNGVFLEVTGTEVALVLRTSTSGSPVDTRVLQDDWNGDKFKGSGPSGVTIDFAKAQILVIDLQWLGVGTVRVGFDVGGLVYAHTFENSNLNPTVYMRSGSLPCRYEIECTSNSEGGASMRQICTSVVREGGNEEEGFLSSYTTSVATPLGATTTPQSALSIRLRSSHIRGFLRPLSAELTNLTSSKMRWEVVLNPTLTGALTWANWGQSGQVSVTQLPYTIGSGHAIGSGSIASQGNSKLTIGAGLGLESVLGVAANIAGTSDIVSFIVESDSAVAQDLIAGFTYLELF